MKNRWSPLLIVAVVYITFGVITSHYYPILPDKIATHFGADGAANGWMEKQQFVGFMAGMLAFILAMTMGMGALLGRIPTELINVPNREYWLAPERRGYTLNYFRHFMNLTGAATGALMVALVEATYRANLKTPPALGSETTALIVVFVAFVVVSLVSLVRQFARVR